MTKRKNAPRKRRPTLFDAWGSSKRPKHNKRRSYRLMPARKIKAFADKILMGDKYVMHGAGRKRKYAKRKK